MTILKLSDSSTDTMNYIFPKTWQLSVGEKKEIFGAIQVEFTGTSPIIVCVIPRDGSEFINPIIVPYSGCILPIEGIGYAASGDDYYGTSFTTDANFVRAIAYGGK